VRHTAIIIAAGLLFVAAACSDDDSTDPDSAVTKDAKVGADSKVTPDLGGLPDLPQKDPCDSEWRDAISPQKTSSTGVVTTTETAGIYKTVADASAGGMTGASKNPFVYLSLTDGKRVDLDDFAAKKSTAWDLAIRRTVIRINGGDSGAGKGALAILSGKKLADVTAAPAASAFATDDFLDASCKVKRNPINNIWTAICGSSGLWYQYSSGGHTVTPPQAVYVIRTAKGDHVKLVIDSYYNSSNQGGHYTLSWAKLK
jgi:hypothetical protein